MARKTDTVIEPDGTPVDNAEVSVRGPGWDDDTLLGLDSFEAALALVQETFGAELVSADETLGNGFTILNGPAKDVLIGHQMIVMSWNFNIGDVGPFVSVQCVAKLPGGGTLKAIINDGSTGIYAQLDTLYQRTGKLGGLHVKHGLRRSDYTYTNDKGEESPASTYYLDTTP
jgi:hypothetical protein